MTLTITPSLIANILINGLAISLAAFFLPFVRVKNFGVAILVGILIALVNSALDWLLGVFGIDVTSSARTLVGFLLYLVSITIVDRFLRGFDIRGLLWLILFAILVMVMDYLLTAFVLGPVVQIIDTIFGAFDG